MITQSKKLEFILGYGTISKSLDKPTTKKFKFTFVLTSPGNFDFTSISQEVDSFTTFVNTVYNFIKPDLQG